ncbi:hypothetical protein DYU11_21700 [Fibrisoma montanum]|uniref:Uncharacterized protein n=1 Tax=Fibrisoma montanum TaxID=2305895 RepID=A0A418M4R8_9BACT|nr:hypothetical protein [Fibrisoma montanum]RIV20653.1 hypothetical protein DYU11_21700 [Fibrisoma montanum]
MARLIFGGIIAILLLGLYAYATIVAIITVECLVQHGPNSTCQYGPNLTEGFTTILNLVGGLVSALVVAVLAVTKPDDPPSALALTAKIRPVDLTKTTQNVVTGVSVAYVIVWLICGLAALVVGYMQHADVVPSLTASGKSWLGLAVAAAYSYLGVNPAR